jgi:hypothetical protein
MYGKREQLRLAIILGFPRPFGGEGVQRFSIGINDVWDYCVNANGDRVTFTELLVTTAPSCYRNHFFLI